MNTGKELKFADNPLYQGAMDFLTKSLLGILVYLASQMKSDIDVMMNSNADLLNRVIEMNVKMDNQNERIRRNERDIKDLVEKFYEE